MSLLATFSSRVLTAPVCLLIGALLAGCAASIPTPRQTTLLSAPRKLHVVQERGNEPASDAVLVVRSDGGNTYWALFDGLGVPRSRQILRDGQWRNDGFLPPNDDARTLFAGLVFAWTPAADLAARYGEDHIKVNGNTRILSINNRAIATVTSAPDGELQLTFDNGDRWRASSLKESR